MWHYLTLFKREAKIDVLGRIWRALVRTWMFLIELLSFHYINCMFWKCAEKIWLRQFPRVMRALRNSAFETNNSLASPLSVPVYAFISMTMPDWILQYDKIKNKNYCMFPESITCISSLCENCEVKDPNNFEWFSKKHKCHRIKYIVSKTYYF